MAQHDMNLANQGGAAFRADANDALAALVSQNSGATEPATMFAYQLWADTTSGWMKQRNASNSAWIKRFPLGTAARTDIASAATLDLDSATCNSDYMRVTGTTTTTAITLADGQKRLLIAAGAWPITHGSSLLCPGSSSYTCAAGDIVLAIGEPSSVVRLVIWKADGTPVVSSASAAADVVGVFRNLQLSAAGTGANISVSADEIALEDSSNSYVTARSVSLTINSAAAGANGLDTGSIAASTWYSVWVIRKPDGTTAGLISASTTSPTLPSGYTYKARVGWIRTDGTGNKYPLSFIQFGRRVRYKLAAGSNLTAWPQMAAGASGSPTTPTWTSVAWANYAPPTSAAIEILAGTTTSGGGGTNYALVHSNNAAGNNNSTTACPLIEAIGIDTGDSGFVGRARGDIPLESSNIYWASTGASAFLNAIGWEDNL